MVEKKRIIAIAGGIGSGKSVVSSILRVMGYYVYDCDKEAKVLMNTLDVIKKELVDSFGSESVTDEGLINTKHISSVVFNDKDALAKINSIVHPRVKEDIIYKLEHCETNVMFIESAILLQSNLLDVISEIWLVEAPESVRIERVMKRNNMKSEDVKARITAQKGQDYSGLPNVKLINNDGIESLLCRVKELICDI